MPDFRKLPKTLLCHLTMLAVLGSPLPGQAAGGVGSATQAQLCAVPGYPPQAGTTVLDLANPIVIPYDRALDLRWQDFDGDADYDLLYWGIGPASQGFGLTVFRNDDLSFVKWDDATSPLFDLNTNSPEAVQGYYDAALVDLDNDGDKDFVGANIGARDKLFEWKNGKFQDPAVVLDPNDRSQFWTCDPVTGELNPCKDVNCENFTLPAGQLCGHRKSTGVDTGDIDMDGDVDLVFAYRDSRPSLYLNDGSGLGDKDGDGTPDSPFFHWQLLPGPPDESKIVDPDDPLFHPFPGSAGRDIHLVDFDRDGDLDLLYDRRGSGTNPACQLPVITCNINAYQTPVVYRNDGFDTDCDGQADVRTPFVFWYKLVGPSGAIPGPNSGNSISVGDVDGDGFPDVVVPVDRSPSGVTYETRIYLNDGTGIVGKDPVTSGSGTTLANNYKPSKLLGDAQDQNARSGFAEVVDINQDGRNDILIGHYFQGVGANPPEPDKIWLNVGLDAAGMPDFQKFDVIDGVMTSGCGSCGPTVDDTRYIRLVDIDHDGDLDYLEANFRGVEQRIFLNRKSDVFVRP